MRQTHNRAEHRRGARLQRLINRAIRTKGDYCGICGRPFTDRSYTFYGAAFSSIVITSDCCRARLEMVVAAGIYIAAVRS
ncbi:MAG: hypothetical protein WBX05_16255 [Pseudolabrys sp.]